MVVLQDRFKSKSVLLQSEWDNVVKGQLDQLTPEEYECLMEMMSDEAKLLEFSSDAMLDEYERIPVSIEEWLSEYYLGDSIKALYAAWKRDLILLFSSQMYDSAILLGSLSSGKSEFASIALLRMLYEASCLKDPAKTYGLASGSKISFCILSKTEQVARAATFDKIVGKIQTSQYFQEDFPVNNRMKSNGYYKGNELTFGKHLALICGSSSDSSILGANVMGGFVDELNFFQKTSKMSIGDSKYGVYGRAGKLFDQLKRRIRSRFQRFGRLPGLLIGASSKTTLDSLTEQFVREAIRSADPTVFVRDYSILDVKPEAFSKQKFKVLVGNEIYSSKILEPGEEENYDKESIVEVPEEFRKDFESSLQDSLRDLLGISTTAIYTFINKTEKLQAMIDTTRVHPWSCPLCDGNQWDSRAPYTIHWNKLATLHENGEWSPMLNPGMKRYISLDPGLTIDAFGLAVGHIAGLIPVQRHDNSQEFTEYVPFYVIDFVLRIKGEPGEEVLFRNVRRIIYEFSCHGFHIAKITSDSFNSREMIQQLKEQGYNAEILSVDEEKDPYQHLRRAIYEERIKCYHYEHLWDELRGLEEGPTKVDHSSNGCFVGETRIPLTDGTTPMISELSNKEVFVYSKDKNGNLVKGKARGRQTKLATNLLDVVLDTGAVARCTPEHPWMLITGEYREAKDLRPNDRLMPIILNTDIAKDSCRKVKQIIPITLEFPVPVYDLEVDEHHNFALLCGVFVHNSKDLADAVCACVYSLSLDATYSEPVLPVKGATIDSGENIDKISDRHNENWQEIPKKNEEIAIVPVSTEQCIYKKKDKAPIMKPGYLKMNPDGTTTDLLNKTEQAAQYILNDILI
jgi:hypothetical protein